MAVRMKLHDTYSHRKPTVAAKIQEQCVIFELNE
jgi:hypothetical protein